MKSMKEAAVADLEAVRKRALRSLAMGRIEEPDCSQITNKTDELIGYILNMKEEGGD